MGGVVDTRFKSSMDDENDPLIMERPTAVRARASASSWMKPAALIVGGTLLAVGGGDVRLDAVLDGFNVGSAEDGAGSGSARRADRSG